ncbi:hypothetical protein MSLAZ_2772 [Methanosarcina lacustris Z-7289]|uniref:Uncharacterized protein n=1 Tax=Methanosarcina lacustris Z-7289 TaxID=1434111 RepID=A0A0E3SA13_9EURY|nr:hypothetical protein [Methanosarcina lacustris]AKB76033.1 hypothetical protein MSLAZ_2772 [Methanosarcina lacustris Z-7289]
MKKLKISAIFAAILLVSIAFVPAVSAKADISQNEKYGDAIDISNEKSISEEDIKKALENTNKISESMNVLSETDNEKIVSFKKDDGSIGYAILWKDEKNSNRTYFAVVDLDELVAKKFVSATSLNDSAVIAAAISAAKSSFANGSYVETYGDNITGGLHIYFSPKDAGLIAYGSSTIIGLLVTVLSSGYVTPTVGSILGTLVGLAVRTWYWYEENSDGSLDLKIPYANIATVIVTQHVYLKIGSHWYSI